MRKNFVFALLVFISFAAYANTTCAASRQAIADTYKIYIDKNIRYTPDSLCKAYNSDIEGYESGFYKKSMLINGNIVRITKGFLGEYIVELKCNADPTVNLSVVYPLELSEKSIREIEKLQKGQVFEALVVCGRTWMHVDVYVWKNRDGFYEIKP